MSDLPETGCCHLPGAALHRSHTPVSQGASHQRQAHCVEPLSSWWNHLKSQHFILMKIDTYSGYRAAVYVLCISASCLIWGFTDFWFTEAGSCLTWHLSKNPALQQKKFVSRHITLIATNSNRYYISALRNHQDDGEIKWSFEDTTEVPHWLWYCNSHLSEQNLCLQSTTIIKHCDYKVIKFTQYVKVIGSGTKR